MKKLHIKGPLKQLFESEGLPARTQKNLYFLTMGGILGGLCCVVCGSGTSALTSLASYLGAGDFTYGVLTAIPLLAALLQIPFSILVSRTHKRRRYMLTYALVGRMLWIPVGLVPLIFRSYSMTLQLLLVICLVSISGCLTAVINVCWMPWMADVSPIRIRGRWMSIKDAIGNICNAAFGLIVGQVLDRMPGIPGYVTVFCVAGVFGIMDMLTYFGVDEVFSSPPAALRVGEVVGKFVRDKRFLWFTVFWTGWCFFCNMSSTYYTRFMVNEMGLTYTQVTIFGTITSSVVTMAAIVFWGRLLDRFGFKPVMQITATLGALTPLIYLTATHGNPLTMMFYNICGALMWSGSNLASTNMQLSYAPDRERASYIALFSCTCNVLGTFLGVLAGGAMLDLLEKSGMGSIRYKVMFATASALRFTFVLIVLPRLENDRGFTVRDMLRGIKN